jgi:hypothetical protein
MWTQSTKLTADSIGHEKIVGVCRLRELCRLIQNQKRYGLCAVQVQIGGQGRGGSVCLHVNGSYFPLNPSSVTEHRDPNVTNHRIPEMEFLVDNSGHKIWFSTLTFPFYKMLFMNRLQISCKAHFCKHF